MARIADSLDFLDALADRFPERVGRAVADCAKDAANVARRLTKGELARSIKVIRTGRTAWSLVADKPYASFVENGRPAVHTVGAKALRFVINGTVLFRKSVGPAAPRPFIGPAADWFEAHVDEYVDRALYGS